MPAILGNPELVRHRHCLSLVFSPPFFAKTVPFLVVPQCYEASMEHGLEGATVFSVNVTDSSFGTLVDIQDDTSKCAYR